MLVHEHSVVKIRDDVPFEAAALISCGVTTGVGAVFNTAKVEAGSTVAVYGTGGVGLSVIQGARIAGARQIIAVDVLESKLATAKEMGATHVVDGSSRDAVEAIHDLTGGGVDYSFEAIGLPKTAEQAILSIRKGGTATLIGVQPDNEQVTIPTSWINSQREWKLQRSSMGSNRFRVDMPKYIDLYLQGRLKLDEMVTRKGKLEDINDFFRAVHEGEVSRTVVTFN
jgi:S-(hydroxymethyl)glutathione dehydrogenase/alcohol dehydrogenase